MILIWHRMNHSVKRRRQALHPKSTSLVFEYQCRSGKFIRLANRIESKLFCPNWNALVESLIAYRSWLIILFGGVTWAQWREQVVRSRYAATPPPCSNPFRHQYIDFYIFWTCALFFSCVQYNYGLTVRYKRICYVILITPRHHSTWFKLNYFDLLYNSCLQCFDTVGCATARASGL